MMTRGKIRKRIPNKPYGRLVGLLSGCITTLIGVVHGVAPFTILCRSLIAAFAIGMTVSLGVAIIRMANVPNELES